MKRFFQYQHDGARGFLLYSEIAGWDSNEKAGFVYLKGGAEICVGADACRELESYFGVADVSLELPAELMAEIDKANSEGPIRDVSSSRY